MTPTLRQLLTYLNAAARRMELAAKAGQLP